MQALLQISELARLSGVTVKTVRHYTKLGLLAEPQRAENGYRLYTANDLLRLQRIKQLQGLGLSLVRIKEVLGKPEQEEHTLRSVLEFVLEELSAQIEILEKRRERVKKLLAEGKFDELNRPLSADAGLEKARKFLEERQIEVSPELWEQEQRMWSVLNQFNWPGDINVMQQQILTFLEEHPEFLQQELELSERFMALAKAREDDPAVDSLIEDFIRHFANFPAKELQLNLPWLKGTMGDLIGELWNSTMSPAQQRVARALSELNLAETNQNKSKKG